MTTENKAGSILTNAMYDVFVSKAAEKAKLNKEYLVSNDWRGILREIQSRVRNTSGSWQ